MFSVFLESPFAGHLAKKGGQVIFKNFFVGEGWLFIDFYMRKKNAL